MADDATDPINEALYAALAGDLQLGAFYVSLFGQQGAPQGGVWNVQADDGTPLPFVTFRALTPGYGYTFGGPAEERYPYEFTAWAEDRDGVMTGEQICSTLVGHVRRVLTDAQLSIAGYELLNCRPYTGVPPAASQGPNARDQVSQGVRFEILVDRP
jgi:hypothetical protein